MKSIAVIIRFRYLNRKGEGSSSMYDPPFRQGARVVIKNAWGDGVRVVQYKGEALDRSLTNFLKRHAHPENQEVFFVPADITFMEREGDAAASPGSPVVGRSRAQASSLGGKGRGANQ